MAADAISPVPVALGSATSDTEEGRAFFQERLGLYAMWIFILSGGFYLLNTVLAADLRVNLTQHSLAHLGATLTLGAVWGTTRAAVLSTPVLRWVDTAALIVSCLLFAVMAGGMAQLLVAAGADPMQALLIGQLAAGSTILTRAVAVPSTPARTFWIGLVALAPQVVYASHVLLNAPVLMLMPGTETVAQMAVAGC